ncbi:choice-of-anchor G family protein [Curtobacterium sp. 24E2]|nr:choice-of-anchor G family protein [Curtobacterium sp. 24E2]
MSRRPLHLRRGRIAVVTGIVVAAALVTPTAVPSTASWSDREWAHGAVGTSSFDCGTDADYTSTASSRFLGGSIAGIDLDDVATVRGVDVAKTGAAPASVEPATAPELGTGGRPFTQAFGNPLDVGLLGDVAGIDLTGLGLGLPAGSAGAVNQVATASGTGEAVAASGLVADSGGVLVTPTTPSGDLPDPASITLGRALPGIADVTDVGLDVGAVGASAQLAGCDAISEDVWGGVVQRTLATNLRAAVQQVAADSGPAGLERDYGIASLDLRVDSPLVGALVTAVNDTVVQLDAAVDALGGQDGVLARTIDQGVLGVLGGLTGSLGLGTIGGTVEITGPDLAGAVAPLLAEPVQDAGGTLSLDLSAGSVRVDLAHLLGDDEHGLNDLPPNHEVVLDAVTLGALADRLGQVVDAWAGKITTALTTALESLHVRIALAADLSAPLVLGIRVKIATLSIGVDTGVAALMAGQTRAVGRGRAARTRPGRPARRRDRPRDVAREPVDPGGGGDAHDPVVRARRDARHDADDDDRRPGRPCARDGPRAAARGALTPGERAAGPRRRRDPCRPCDDPAVHADRTPPVDRGRPGARGTGPRRPGQRRGGAELRAAPRCRPCPR